jgi:hypothetical protein
MATLPQIVTCEELLPSSETVEGIPQPRPFRAVQVNIAEIWPD